MTIAGASRVILGPLLTICIGNPFINQRVELQSNNGPCVCRRLGLIETRISTFCVGHRPRPRVGPEPQINMPGG